MKITTARVANFKRVRDITLSPAADSYLILIAGNNAQGKSSLLDALTVALGGKRAQPADPVRHGADRAVIEVTFDGGYTVTRSIQPGGESKLVIRGPDGPVAKPQALLDRLVGERFLDPLSFLASPAKEQRRLLLEVAGVDTSTLDATRQKAFDKRTEVGRDLTKAKADLERLPAVPPAPPEARAHGEIVAELTSVRRQREEICAAARELGEAGRAHEAAAAEVERLTAMLAQAEVSLRAAADRHLAAQSAAGRRRPTLESLSAREAELDREFAGREAFSRWQAQAEQLESRRAQAQAEADKLAAHHAKLTGVVEDMDAKKAAALARATMPVDDLGFSDDGITLGGVPFDQASQAERLRCALAIAMRLSPELRDVWVRDGSLLDDTSLAILAELAEAADCRVWVERVGESDEGAIVIRDGALVE